MIWCGCHMIMFWVHDSALMKVVGAMFFVNGWSAFGAHTFNNALCGAVDKLSMLFTVWLVAGFCFEELIEASSAYDSSTKYFASCSFMKWYDGLLMPLAGVREVSGKESSKAAVKATAERSFNRSFFTGGLWCGCCSLLWWAVGKEIDAPDQGFFIMMFGLPIAVSLSIAIIIGYSRFDEPSDTFSGRVSGLTWVECKETELTKLTELPELVQALREAKLTFTQPAIGAVFFSRGQRIYTMKANEWELVHGKWEQLLTGDGKAELHLDQFITLSEKRFRPARAVLQDYSIERLWFGVRLMIVGAGSWGLTESYCDESAFFRWFPGHVLWHVCMSVGLTHALIFAIMLRANNFRASVVRIGHEGEASACNDIEMNQRSLGPIARWYFWFLPGFVFMPDLQPQLSSEGAAPVKKLARFLEA
mmetsp:Transcript_58113/g.129552  ORF Transcript_58113/g.129552 Transcript_58113/m.129552 type:complete len:419 (-) Transcript_58113:261-1517(-)